MAIPDYANLIQDALKTCLDRRQPYVLWDFPNYSNVGDSAIWLGQLAALKQFFGRDPFHTCEIFSQSTLLPRINKNVQIILQGGGNFGDLWESFQLFREHVVKSYPLNRIILMPQSIHFTRLENLERCQKIFSAHRDLCIMTRDQPSYSLAKQLHAGRSLLVPDMALALGHQLRPCEPSIPILTLLRSDKESLLNRNLYTDELVMPVDWLAEPRLFETKILSFLGRAERVLHRTPFSLPKSIRTFLFGRLALARFRRGCELLSSGKVVITDRLHAHILCVLMDIPHVVLDNNYGKISRFRAAWSSGSVDLCMQASSMMDACTKARILLEGFPR